MTVQPRRCPYCEAPGPARGACAKPACLAAQRVEWRARDLRRRMRKAGRCRLCGNAPEEGSRFCRTHLFMREPCPQCGSPVERPERGRLPTFCCARCRMRSAYEWRATTEPLGST